LFALEKRQRESPSICETAMRAFSVKLVILFVVTALVRLQLASSFALAGFFGGPIIADPDIDLPANPTNEQLVATGKKQTDKLGTGDQTLDRNQALNDYMNSLAQRLLKAQDTKPPYPIEIHVSTQPVTNAYADAGGQIVFYTNMILETDNEAQLVAILAHEMSHELHDDFVFFWNAAKNGEDSYGKGGLLEQSGAIEQRADLEATRMMYAAGWDPSEQIVVMERLQKKLQVLNGGHRLFFSTHPEDRERIEAIRRAVAALPPKKGLITDSPQYDEIKKSL
jgi:beta-barrel assembly-enhancing protease